MPNNDQVVTRGSSNEATIAGSVQTTSGARSPSRQQDRDEATLLPPADVIEDSGGITLYADLPGVRKDRLDVRVEADTLSIEGELALDALPELTASHAEVRITRYRRTFTLSKELDADQVDAEFTDGVLRLRIPKSDEAKPKRIAVQVH